MASRDHTRNRTPASPAAAGARSESGVVPCLLIIDDEEGIRRAIARFFARRGWSTEQAADGVEGLAKLTAPDAALRYAAVVCDLRMPGLSGVELHRRLAERSPALLERLVLFTGDVSSAGVASFLAETSCPVLAKPFELTSLGEAVDAVAAWRVRPAA